MWITIPGIPGSDGRGSPLFLYRFNFEQERFSKRGTRRIACETWRISHDPRRISADSRRI